MERQMKCPICHTENDDNWPVKVDDKISYGGCQECWEEQTDAEWWKVVIDILRIQHGESINKEPAK